MWTLIQSLINPPLEEVKRKYLLVRDYHDSRDLIATFKLNKDLSEKVDLRIDNFGVYDQGHLGSCTANAICANYYFIERKENKESFQPSRLFLYYNERKLEGTTDSDSGASIRDGFKSMSLYGMVEEDQWKYDISQFKTEPPVDVYNQAIKNCTKRFYRITDNKVDHLKTILNNGFPFVFGMLVFSSFESPEVAKSGMVPLPTENDQQLGGHALLCMGYDDEKKSFLIRNSWGESWGLGGYCYIPYDYISNPKLVWDLWYLESVNMDNKRLRKIRNLL